MSIKSEGEALQARNEPRPASPSVSDHPPVDVVANVATPPPLAPPQDRPPGATVATSPGSGEAAPNTEAEGGALQVGNEQAGNEQACNEQGGNKPPPAHPDVSNLPPADAATNVAAPPLLHLRILRYGHHQVGAQL